MNSSAYILRLGICILPVLGFLGALVLLDSFKLAPIRRVALCLALGGLVAGIALYLSIYWLRSEVPTSAWTTAPAVEELFKALVLVWLIRRGHVGFMVEGAIYGFAAGAGFAAVENVIYLHYLGSADLFLWFVRGVGTAIMHGGGTAIAGILAASQAHRAAARQAAALTGGWLIATGVHTLYNSPLLSPVAAASLIVVGVPALMAAMFMSSERAVEDWLGEGFDQDMELLGQIASGEFRHTPAGAYLQSMRESFPAKIVADMFCVLQVSTELAIRAKAEILKREIGFGAPPDRELQERLMELKHLEKSIGATGRLALAPLLGARTRRLWELRQLGYSSV